MDRIMRDMLESLERNNHTQANLVFASEELKSALRIRDLLCALDSNNQAQASLIAAIEECKN